MTLISKRRSSAVIVINNQDKSRSSLWSTFDPNHLWPLWPHIILRSSQGHKSYLTSLLKQNVETLLVLTFCFHSLHISIKTSANKNSIHIFAIKHRTFYILRIYCILHFNEDGVLIQTRSFFCFLRYCKLYYIIICVIALQQWNTLIWYGRWQWKAKVKTRKQS